MTIDPLDIDPNLRTIFDEAEDKIGYQRAMIALQGVLHRYSSLQRIDGLLREETIVAARIAVIKVGAERLAEEYAKCLIERFPTEYAIKVDVPAEHADAFETDVAEIEHQIDADEPVQPKKIRRRK